MKTVWKYTLEIVDGPQNIAMPTGAEILTAKEQQGALCLWALANDTSHQSSTIEKRTFVVYGTGHRIREENAKYVGTVLTYGGHFVWHIFELKG